MGAWDELAFGVGGMHTDFGSLCFLVGFSRSLGLCRTDASILFPHCLLHAA